MEGQFKEKPQPEKRVVKNVNLKDVPIPVNEKLKKYQRKISAERGRKYNLKTSYVEFLKEATKSI